MISIPVLNTWNNHRVRMVINLFPKEKLTDTASEHLQRLAHLMAKATDLMLDERCLLAAGAAQQHRKVFRSTGEFHAFLIGKVRELLQCKAVAVFKVNDTWDRLELADSTGTTWRTPTRPFYTRDDGYHTSQVWKHNCIRYHCHTSEGLRERAHSWEETEDPDDPRDQSLMAPLARHGSAEKVLGVVRCRNRMNDHLPGPDMFTDDDAAVLDAFIQAALPQLELLHDQERTARFRGRMFHEFHTPNNAIRHCVQRMRSQFRKNGIPHESYFGLDFLGDIWGYTDTVGAYLAHAETVQSIPTGIKPAFRLSKMMGEVVAPAVNHLFLLLKQKGLNPERIVYSRMMELPPLWIDPNKFQQVFFNLLSNAVKYGGSPSEFLVTISVGVMSGKSFHIFIEDRGPGVPELWQERIFEDGFRGNAKETDVTGHGLGLGIVRKIVQAHGGEIHLVHCAAPTRFRITLPYSLALGPPTR